MPDTPEYHAHEEFINRTRKLADMRALGIDPYPPRYNPKHHAQELHQKFNGLNSDIAKMPPQAPQKKLLLPDALSSSDRWEKVLLPTCKIIAGESKSMINRDLTTGQRL